MFIFLFQRWKNFQWMKSTNIRRQLSELYELFFQSICSSKTTILSVHVLLMGAYKCCDINKRWHVLQIKFKGFHVSYIWYWHTLWTFLDMKLFWSSVQVYTVPNRKFLAYIHVCVGIQKNSVNFLVATQVKIFSLMVSPLITWCIVIFEY